MTLKNRGNNEDTSGKDPVSYGSGREGAKWEGSSNKSLNQSSHSNVQTEDIYGDKKISFSN